MLPSKLVHPRKKNLPFGAKQVFVNTTNKFFCFQNNTVHSACLVTTPSFFLFHSNKSILGKIFNVVKSSEKFFFMLTCKWFFLQKYFFHVFLRKGVKMFFSQKRFLNLHVLIFLFLEKCIFLTCQIPKIKINLDAVILYIFFCEKCNFFVLLFSQTDRSLSQNPFNLKS